MKLNNARDDEERLTMLHGAVGTIAKSRLVPIEPLTVSVCPFRIDSRFPLCLSHCLTFSGSSSPRRTPGARIIIPINRLHLRIPCNSSLLAKPSRIGRDGAASELMSFCVPSTS